jgi:RNA recognition motif-containing protein
VKVDNLPYDTRPEDLKDVFSKYGEVKDIYLPKDRASGRPRGFAFVRYAEQSEADAAVAAEQGAMLLGRPVTLEIAKYGKETSGASVLWAESRIFRSL